MSAPCSDHDECMICLSSLLLASEAEAEVNAVVGNGVGSSSSGPDEIGAVFPCGHVFHLKCWQQWRGERCPSCNQVASLFSKIFISAPPRVVEATTTTSHAQAPDLSAEERLELGRFRQREREEEEDRMLLRDMEKRMEEDPQGAKMMMNMMMMVQSLDLRKSERELLESQEECETAKEILSVTQSDLEEATKELGEVKPKAESLQDEVDRLKRVRWAAASHRNEKHKQQIDALQAKLDRYKEKLTLKNRQLSRRNKELLAKRNLISSHKMELAATGQEHQRMCEKTKDELRRTKKELELVRELDSLTMGESMSSFGNGSLSWH